MKQQQDVKILLVDDDEGHADLVKVNLERSGVMNEILYFSNGQKVLNFLFQLEDSPKQKDEKYLMILDINMPGLNGHQVLERVKKDPHTRSIPIIMLTTAEDEKEVGRCYASGCSLYMAKPMEYEVFCEAVRELGLFIQRTRFPGIIELVA
jgi:CheY-like chemotaxis protein